MRNECSQFIIYPKRQFAQVVFVEKQLCFFFVRYKAEFDQNTRHIGVAHDELFFFFYAAVDAQRTDLRLHTVLNIFCDKDAFGRKFFFHHRIENGQHFFVFIVIRIFNQRTPVAGV